MAVVRVGSGSFGGPGLVTALGGSDCSTVEDVASEAWFANGQLLSRRQADQGCNSRGCQDVRRPRSGVRRQAGRLAVCGSWNFESLRALASVFKPIRGRSHS